MFFLHIVLSGVHKSFNGMPPTSRAVIDGRIMGYFIWRRDWFLMLIDLALPNLLHHEAVPQVRFIWKATMVLEGRTRCRSAFSERPLQRGNKLAAVDVLLL